MADNFEDKVAKKAEEVAIEQEAARRAQANRGVDPTPAPVSYDRNPSGTYSEPTPSDVRYGNKLETEFENNRGAFIGKSAAQIREQLGMPDAPGGLKPEGASDEQKAVVDKRQLPTPEAVERHVEGQKEQLKAAKADAKKAEKA